MTLDGRPAAMAGWACRIPSKIHRIPKLIRSSRCPAASAATDRTAARAPSHSLALIRAMASTARRSRAMRP